ncbi:MAG: hypothetical protein IJY81_04085 [Lachnospiraceae bacterium]|nr:hypothetical protein [Lachnospira sp.]MBQ8730348.1 hypothetical protein [Lachnospiraceae bacterium]
MSEKTNIMSKLITVIILCVLVGTFIAIECRMEIEGVALSLGMFIVSAVVHLLGRKYEKLYRLTMFINSVAMGILMGSYYVWFDKVLKVTDALIVSSIAIVFFLIIWFEFHFLKDIKMPTITSIVLVMVSLVVIVSKWNKADMLCYLMFMIMFTEIFIVVMLITNNNKRNVYRDISIASFGAPVVVVYMISALVRGNDFVNIESTAGGKNE